MSIYNEGLICLQQNLQVQKASFIEDVIHTVAARILELKNQLRKLESHRYQFFGNGLMQHLLTFDNIEPNDLLQKVKRSERLQAMIDEVVLRIEQKKETELQKLSKEENTLIIEHEKANIWDSDDENEDDVKDYVCEVKQEISEESLRRSEMIKLIQAHERSRQVTRWDTERRFKRTMWEKELSGTLKPQARFEIKERAARLIQNIFRAYFRIKRDRTDHCKVDEILGIDSCQKHIAMDKTNDEQMLEQLNKKKRHILEWKKNWEQVEAQYKRRVKDDLAEEHRGYKEGFVRDVDKSNACMNTKMAIMTTVDDDMRQELKILKKALQEDYRINNEKMPEMIKRKIKRPKRRPKLKSTITESVQEKLEELVVADAKLFELDPTEFPPNLMTREKLRQIAANVVTCARALQPSVIHLKYLQLIYCKKAPPGKNRKYLDMFKQCLIQNLLKKIRKNDLITVIGSCCDPWLTATNIMLKKFPDVVMLPDTTYPTASMILTNWKNANRVVPRNLNLQSLAQFFEGTRIDI
ncbi:unnamed protein product, partial [Iphiclides podalirius]